MADLYIENGSALVYLGSGEITKEVIKTAGRLVEPGKVSVSVEDLNDLHDEIKQGNPPKDLGRFSTQDLQNVTSRILSKVRGRGKEVKIHIV